MPELLDIEKAFEVALAAAVDAQYGAGSSDPTDAACMIHWQGMKFDPKDKPLYVRPSMHGYEEMPKTLGPNPAIERSGYYSVDCFLKTGNRADPLRTLAETVKSAYPYNTDLTAGGAVIQIERIRVGDTITLSAWLYRPVDIYWRVHI